ncbi:hypothetical protein LMG27952_02014 [Paraburkholderia hiiakae]|uniref:Uncharacterized protein n=1 Tax=Paraburkholderia hiiakae TaxID=1081782 RepID=A0ABN7HM88_9BURK|nr:hypothetical protein LMG27952_02014 [Paraburkholderia hiiakae]
MKAVWSARRGPLSSIWVQGAYGGEVSGKCAGVLLHARGGGGLTLIRRETKRKKLPLARDA